tara:strand:+ start:1587 stop:1892 length:306 start_codon:yes stop_codon:yes gene_type:complete
MKNILILLSVALILSSCGGLDDASKVLRNEKVRTTDEFLVKKRNPLEVPPDYEQIPTPGSIINERNNEEDKIKKILKVPKTQDSKSNNSSVEDSILNRIRK